MTWHYRAFKVIPKKGTPYYCVKEFFSIVGDKGRAGWTKDAIEPIGETKKELIKTLEMMLKDIKHYRTKVERL